jgi:hypothetical protein
MMNKLIKPVTGVIIIVGFILATIYSFYDQSQRAEVPVGTIIINEKLVSITFRQRQPMLVTRPFNGNDKEEIYTIRSFFGGKVSETSEYFLIREERKK